MKIAIWDNHFDKEFLFRDPKNWLFIEDRSAFDNFQDFKQASVIYLASELKWETDSSYTAFYGFELLIELRRSRILCPIFMCSYLPKNYFLNLGKVPYGLLFLKYSHPFIQLPQLLPVKEYAHDVHFISERRLEDGLAHYSDQHGALNEIFHYLKNHIVNDPAHGIDYAFSNLEKIINRDKWDELRAIRIKMEEALKEHPKSPPRLVTQYKAEIKRLLPKSSIPEEEEMEKEPWLVLFIDDLIYHRKKIQALFMEVGITCITAESGAEAIKKLERDHKGKLESSNKKRFYPPNSICVVISDYRFETEEGDWFPMQGYDIVTHIVQKLPNFLSLFMLTTKSSVVNTSKYNIPSINIKWYAKEDVLDTGSNNGFNVFCSQIRAEGRNIYSALHQYPKASVWTKPWNKKIDVPLQLFYRFHRLSKEYYLKEKWIGLSAKDFIEKAEMVKDKQLFKRYTKIKDVGFSLKFKTGIKTPPPSPKDMDSFYIKLIGRRIALGLYLMDWSIDEISDILRYQELKDESPDRQLLSSYLALSLDFEDVIPDQLLIEEKLWLEDELKIALDSADRTFYEQLKIVLDDIIDKLRELGADDPLLEGLNIANSIQLERELKKMSILCNEYGLYTFFIEKLHAFGKYEKDFSNPFKQNNYSSILKNIEHLFQNLNK